LQNFKTKQYYCPSKTLLDTVATKSTPCEIRIENASKEKGYFLFADYDSDYLADVLNISKDVGMPLITWVRTGTDNQKIKLVKAELPKVEPPKDSVSNDSIPADSGVGDRTGLELSRAASAMPARFAVYDGAARVIRLAKTVDWAVLDLNGVVVRRGYGHEINAKNMRQGAYFVRSGSKNAKVMVR
jgi:hypothetical protein